MLYLVTDLTFGTGKAIVVGVAFFALIAWRWWAIAPYRTWRDTREGVGKPEYSGFGVEPSR